MDNIDSDICLASSSKAYGLLVSAKPPTPPIAMAVAWWPSSLSEGPSITLTLLLFLIAPLVRASRKHGRKAIGPHEAKFINMACLLILCKRSQ